MTGVYRPRDVSQEPDVRLTQWRVYEVDFTRHPRLPPGAPGVTRHFVGFNLDTCDGRVSGPIQTFNKTRKIGVTRSGRRYQLVGDAGINMDSEYVFGVWLRSNGITDMSKVKDVSDAY